MSVAHPLSSLPLEARESFPGQQEGERILYMIRPHWAREVAGYIKTALLAGAAIALVWYLRSVEVLRLDEGALVQTVVLIALLGAMFALYVRQLCEQSRAYVTDRRVVRFEGAVPVWQSQRGLFWTDVVKTRTFAPNMVLRILKVGSLEIIPNFAAEGQNVLIPYAYMYGDLGSYIEKLIFTFRSRPTEMGAMREFVPKPKGKRY